MSTAFTRTTLRRSLAAAAALLLPLTAGCTGLPAAEEDPAPVEATTEPANPDSLPADEAEQLDAALNKYADQADAEISAAVYETATGRAWYYNPTAEYLEASLVKVPILLTLLRQATEQERELTLEEEYLAVMMIEYSDNNATTTLYQAVGGAPELSRTYELLGVTETQAAEIWGANATGVEDQLKVARAVLDGVDWINSDLQAYAVELMENVEADQQWGISAGLPAGGAEVALKNGWLQDDDLTWNVGSLGFVRSGGAEYAVVVLTSGTETMEDGVSVVEDVASVINSFETTGTPGTPPAAGDTDDAVWRAGGPEA
ncbi:serine hydrolase [Arthrobacter sp. zg-Y820]|uniref:serine hydrolase n=1 Tax=unclassified Arthrobacter TaxID=235627 RepID=UPI001E4CE0F6|nr:MULTISPECIES: serine hydrolase [unclassified Arthrobacter]MCC9196276.1 class A beta-lactamase-related serine hydrolase [Arthrobacter sp. zg-Y820]MDK1279137.1 serine hydrolase [Arthrobacter sp. zg.Y820]WIB08458.1 serine hydrolase [Arthrobacter sp. zg-Y820]